METLALRLWQSDDLPLLHRANSPEMTAHLNGPETVEQVEDRQARYLTYRTEGETRMFVILLDGVAVGSIGYWKVRWREQEVWETGWFVLPEAQGHGIAARALTLVIDEARRIADEHGRHLLVAFPGVDNPGSNAVCRRAGFSHVGTMSGVFREQNLEMNEWALDLGSPDTGSAPNPPD
ncbi:GNAT family N-acetyltransferase [Microbacterium sp. EST19A]|uniref:GNAT family N-acetyltransferase n=1 Tax=Microbacterium sp. EST19A TaxID=2862681 RepID=UPI001CBE3ADC|nr:GNAT family N-acetyltransferase [Microbacterium sp. EST19A]